MRAPARVPLVRALSKLGILTRSEAAVAIRSGRVTVGGRLVRDPSTLVALAGLAVDVDGQRWARATWRTILFHKPRGVVTTRHDPDNRQTVYDVLGEACAGLKPVGRLDRASSGLLLMTSDFELADWITDPRHGVPRVYVVTVRGRVERATLGRLTAGVGSADGVLRASAVELRKVSGRESHLTVELREGKNREVRRLFDSLGHEVTWLKRVALGGLLLDRVPPGGWRPLTPHEVRRAFPGCRLHEFSEPPDRRS